MAVVSLTITESSTQLISGIPRDVSVSANIPSTIFYTLDETEPSISSNIYTSAIILPTDEGKVVLKLFATNGTDSSSIITREYSSNISNIRRAYSEVFGLDNPKNNESLFPFGDNAPNLNIRYGNYAGEIVDAPDVPTILDGYDADGYAVGSTDKPIDEYKIIYSETDSEGQIGRGIGTLPSDVKVLPPEPEYPETQSSVTSKFFNAKAAVIYQDSRETPFDPDIIQINRQFFNLENPEVVRDGATLFNTGFDGQAPTGSFLRQHFNPRDNTITYYYRCSATNRWIISKEPFTPKIDLNLFNIVFSPRDKGVGFIYKWVPFVGRKLI